MSTRRDFLKGAFGLTAAVAIAPLIPMEAVAIESELVTFPNTDLSVGEVWINYKGSWAFLGMLNNVVVPATRVIQAPTIMSRHSYRFNSRVLAATTMSLHCDLTSVIVVQNVVSAMMLDEPIYTFDLRTIIQDRAGTQRVVNFKDAVLTSYDVLYPSMTSSNSVELKIGYQGYTIVYEDIAA